MKLGGSQGGEDTEGVGESKQEEKQPDFTVYNLDVLKNEIKSIETDLGKSLMTILLCLRVKTEWEGEKLPTGRREMERREKRAFCNGGWQAT